LLFINDEIKWLCKLQQGHEEQIGTGEMDYFHLLNIKNRNHACQETAFGGNIV
jgi:hypothetical protein